MSGLSVQNRFDQYDKVYVECAADLIELPQSELRVERARNKCLTSTLALNNTVASRLDWIVSKIETLLPAHKRSNYCGGPL